MQFPDRVWMFKLLIFFFILQISNSGFSHAWFPLFARPVDLHVFDFHFQVLKGLFRL
jgi:hypothetical protein